MGKIRAYCPFNGYQYFQPTRVLLPRFFLFVFLFGKHLSTWNTPPPPPPFHPFKEPFNIHMQTFPTFKQKPFCNLTSLGESMMILWATHNNPQIRMGGHWEHAFPQYIPMDLLLRLAHMAWGMKV